MGISAVSLAMKLLPHILNSLWLVGKGAFVHSYFVIPLYMCGFLRFISAFVRGVRSKKFHTSYMCGIYLRLLIYSIQATYNVSVILALL